MKIDNCAAEHDGGAFFVRDPINMQIKSSTIKNCKAGTKGNQFNEIGEGGGIYYECNIAEEATVNQKLAST
jgi:hypothetical protein